MNKRTIFLALSLTVFGFSLAQAASMSPRESNTDRPGGDFEAFTLPKADPLLCENTCGANTRCLAWNYDPTPAGGGTLQNPRCFLKDSARTPTLRLRVTSGVKIVEPRGATSQVDAHAAAVDSK
jgi:PAN domain-containing protein